MRRPGEAAAELVVERVLPQVALGPGLAVRVLALEARDRGSAVLGRASAALGLA